MLKRLFDIVFSFIGLVVLSPLFLLVSILIKLDSKGPVFYRGVRIGRFGKSFRIYKFRTLVANADKIGGPSTADDDPRITKIGRLIRKYKLDEFPQLINVLFGKMSLVGPRPQVPEDVALYTKEERAILNVLPGITDYASIKFSNEGKILRGSTDTDKVYVEKIRSEKLRLELVYARNHSLGIDFKILLKTLRTLFDRGRD